MHFPLLFQACHGTSYSAHGIFLRGHLRGIEEALKKHGKTGRDVEVQDRGKLLLPSCSSGLCFSWLINGTCPKFAASRF